MWELVTKVGEKGHQFHAVVSIHQFFHGNNAIMLTVCPRDLAEVCMVPYTKITHWHLGNNKFCKSQSLQRENANKWTSP